MSFWAYFNPEELVADSDSRTPPSMSELAS